MPNISLSIILCLPCVYRHPTAASSTWHICPRQYTAYSLIYSGLSWHTQSMGHETVFGNNGKRCTIPLLCKWKKRRGKMLSIPGFLVRFCLQHPRKLQQQWMDLLGCESVAWWRTCRSKKILTKSIYQYPSTHDLRLKDELGKRSLKKQRYFQEVYVATLKKTTVP